MPRRLPALGHALIDRQHRQLAVLGSALTRAVARDRRVAGALGALLRATRRHFASEERLMRARAYPELAGHRALHNGVLVEMAALRAQLARRTPVHPRQAARFAEWLDHHISEADRNLVAFLRRQA